MRILFSITYYSPYVSGLTIYVKRLAEELARRGHEVTVLCMRHDNNLPELEILNGVKVVRARPFLKISKGFLSWDWIVKSCQEGRRAEAVVVNLPQAEGWIPAMIARNKKVVAVYHCEIDLPNKTIQTGVEMANRLSLKTAKKIITYTEDYGKNCRLLKGFEDKTKYIYPPIPVPKAAGLGIKKPKGEAWIGAAARLAQEKGIEYLLEALPMIKGKIVIAGPMEPVGEEGYKNKIMKLVEKYKDRVMFLGTIDPEKMGGFYKLIDVLVLPSVNSTEAFGMVQVEAMMMGVPVVASDLPGVRVPIQKTRMGILVPPRNPPKIAQAVQTVIRNKQKYIRPEAAAREFAMGKTVKFYESLL